MVPYVWTSASQGVLHGIQGFQDITLAAKYNVLEKPSTANHGSLRAIAVVSEEITLKAGEQRQAALLSGKAAASDIAAGLALGQAVAAGFVARAGADGMGAAGGTPALWQALAAAAVARGEIPWKSMDVPARPPMLPVFGSVRAWMMTPEQIVKERPGPPPSTSSALMAREVAEVTDKVDHVSRAELAIVNKWADGPSTPTPPGHWHFIAWPYVRKAEFSEVRTARVFALLNMAMHDAAVGCWDTKFLYFNPRPSQMDPDLKTVIGLPNFPSYTSGHSTFSAAAAEVLAYLFPSGAADFEALRKKPRSHGCMLAFTIGLTSRLASPTASGSEATRSVLPGPTAPTFVEPRQQYCGAPDREVGARRRIRDYRRAGAGTVVLSDSTTPPFTVVTT